MPEVSGEGCVEEMHLYNLWLPEPVLVETARERESFAKVVKSTIEIWRPDDPDSVDSTLKFIPIIDMSVSLLQFFPSSSIIHRAVLMISLVPLFYCSWIFFISVQELYEFRLRCNFDQFVEYD